MSEPWSSTQRLKKGKEDHSYESTEKCAQKGFDRADIVRDFRFSRHLNQIVINSGHWIQGERRETRPKNSPKLPLGELWDESGPLQGGRVRHLDQDLIRELMRTGTVQFIVADGMKLNWIATRKPVAGRSNPRTVRDSGCHASPASTARSSN
jgi:hypothetical protein